MIFITWKGLFVIFLLLHLSAVCSSFQVQENTKALIDETIQSANAIDKGLQYFKDRLGVVTVDVILGVLIVKANLKWILNKLQRNNSFSKQLENLVEQCNDVIYVNQTENYPIFRNTIWDNAAEDLRWGNFNTYKYVLPRFDSCESIDSYMMQGTPEDSDVCISELINSECIISDKCWFSETNQMAHFGYKTSHRLLYFIIASKLQCEKKNPKKFLAIKTIKHNLCQQMFSEVKALFQEPHFPLTRDLFLEQIALCGLEGYEEFAPYVWRKNIRSWQNSHGCFGHDMDFEHCRINTNRVKRTDTTVDGCHTHVTAVALSSLAFFLRCTIKANFNLP